MQILPDPPKGFKDPPRQKSKKKSKSLINKRLGPQAIFILFIFGLFIISTLVLIIEGNAIAASVYWTACSLTWANCETTIIYTPIVKILSIINALAAIVVVLVLLFTLGEKGLGIDIRGIKMKKKIEDLKSHFIVCGYGRVGEHVCTIFEENNVDYVVIEKKKELTDELKEKEVLVINGDATDPRNIEKAGVARARGLVSAMGSDADNIFIVLTARELNSNLTIASRAYSEAAVKRLHRAGAEIVVLPELVGGLELGKEILKLDITYKEKLVSREAP